ENLSEWRRRSLFLSGSFMRQVWLWLWVGGYRNQVLTAGVGELAPVQITERGLGPRGLVSDWRALRRVERDEAWGRPNGKGMAKGRSRLRSLKSNLLMPREIRHRRVLSTGITPPL